MPSENPVRSVNVGIVGLGNVGTGALSILAGNAAQIEAKLGFPLQVRTVSGLLNIGPWRQGLNGRTRQCAIRSYQALPIEACRQRLAALSRASGPAGPQPPDDRRSDRRDDRGCALDADWWSPDPSPAGA